jgi:hypothetical protein
VDAAAAVAGDVEGAGGDAESTGSSLEP